MPRILQNVTNRSGTLTGRVTSATSTTLVDSTAAFVTTGGGLIGRYVYALDATGLMIQRRRITANTATALTISAAWTTTPNTTYTYSVGAVDFQFDTNTDDMGYPFNRKRLQRLYLQTVTNVANTLFVDIFNNFATTPTRTVSVALATIGAVYGTGVYGTAQFGSARSTSTHVSLARVVQSAGIRLRALLTSGQITIAKLQLSAELLSDNLGGGEGGTQVR